MPNQLQNEINLKDIFQASQTPNAPIALKCHAYLCSASVDKIDHFLRSLLGYTKRESKDWTPKRLARCLDYIYIHGMKLRLEQNLQLASFKACFRWAVDMFSKTIHDMQDSQYMEISHQILYAVKFTCGVMESLNYQLPNAHITSSIVSDLIYRQGVKGLLYWSQAKFGPICSYAIRALTAQKHRLAKEIAASNGIIILSKLVVDIPRLLNTLSLKPPVTDAVQREGELIQCVTICALMDDVLKLKGPSEELTSFIDSDAFKQIISVWCSACQFHHSLTDGSFTVDPNYVSKCQPTLVYSLTSIVQRCTAASNNAAYKVNDNTCREQWHPLLILLMRRWILYNCGQQVDDSSKNLEFDSNILIKLFQITLDLAKVTPTDEDPDVDPDLWDILSESDDTNTDKLFRDFTNFLMAYVLQPVSNDTIEIIGSGELMDKYQLLQKDKDSYQFDGEKIKQDEDMLASYFDVYIHHFRHASPNLVKWVATRMANCLKAIAIVLSDANQLETSGLRSRLTSLIMRFMREPEAIDAFATLSTKISSFLWSPLINHAKRGLVAAANLSPGSELTETDGILINRSRNALGSLRNIAYRDRGLEALLKCDLLQLIDESLIPSGEVMQKSTQLLGLYALFGQLIDAICRSAFIRGHLGDECSGLPPLIIKLLREAITLKENRRTLIQKESDKKQKKVKKDPIFKGCINLISSCLKVVGSFQYVNSSVTLWFCYDNQKEVKDEDIVMSTTTTTDASNPSNTTEKLSILPYLICILLPWRNKKGDIRFYDIMYYINTDLQLMLMVSQLLEIFTNMHSLCGKQLITDSTALSNLGLLMVCLRSVRYGRGEKYYSFGPSFPVIATSNTNCHEPYEIQQLPETPYKIYDEHYHDSSCREEWDEEDGSDYESEPFENTPTVRCADKIKRSVINILTGDRQFIIMSDAFTSFFKFIMQHLITGTSQDYWRREVCSDLYRLGMKYYLELYRFSKYTENAIKLHEMSAVAVGYAAIGAETGQQWNEALGLTVLNDCMVSTPEVFGTLCQMLVYELEYEDQSKKDESTDEVQSLLNNITPLRRHAAAQAIEALAFSFEKEWRLENLASIKETKTLPKHVTLTNPPEIVNFVTDDAESNTCISGNRQLLGACSPIFEALLSGDYAESKLSAIPIHDVTFHSLELFIRTVHQLDEKAEMTKQEQHVTQSNIQNNALDSLTSWNDIVDLLQISDRFASTAVKDFCQYWVLNKVKTIHLIGKKRHVYLNELLRLYRRCRDPIEIDGGITSNTWPFATVLYEVLKTITQYMKEVSKIKEFNKMIKDKNTEELDAFCNGIAYLLQRKD
jgi:hypothetical protein